MKEVTLKPCPFCGAEARVIVKDGFIMERHGRWSFDGECSECGEFDVQDPFGSAYCPHCGAKMDGGDDNAVD